MSLCVILSRYVLHEFVETENDYVVDMGKLVEVSEQC